MDQIIRGEDLLEYTVEDLLEVDPTTSGPSQNLAGPSLNHANLQFNSGLSQYQANSQGPSQYYANQQVNPGPSQYHANQLGPSQYHSNQQFNPGPSQYHANRQVNPGPSQYHANLQVNPGPSQCHAYQQINPGSTEGTDVSPGAPAMQRGNKKPLSRSISAINSRNHREKKKQERKEMKVTLNDVMEENKRLKADNDHLNRLSLRHQDTLRQEKEANAALKIKCDDLENTVRLCQQMVINTDNLQTEYPFLEKNVGKDANEMLAKKYGKLKLKNKLLKTANRALSFQIMKYNDYK